MELKDQSKLNKFYIGHTINKEDRSKDSSGGIGTLITKYLLTQEEYKTTITFVFNQKQCMYLPKLIYSSDEINICGSVYQDIDIFKFIKENLNKIKGGIIVTSPPCQITSIKQLLNKNNIKHFIISYCCSGQTTIEGTWCYYRFLGIRKENIINMQYRGNGWPSGIQIWTDDNCIRYYENYTEPWATIHQSKLFRPKRCFYCKHDTGYKADIAIADPWLEKYIKNDNIGNTLFIINTELGQEVFKQLRESKQLEYVPSNYNEYAIAQKPNIQKELILSEHKKLIKQILALQNNKLYFKWATHSLRNMRIHNLLIQHMNKPYSITQKLLQLLTKVGKIKKAIRSKYIRSQLGQCKSKLYIPKGITINNPKCIYIGKNVGIGSNTYLGPVTEYAGISYNPKIIIGDGTWIGKNCSIAAINKVQIGKNVLFAGHVHITDHSHGYENINEPIFKQPLISKGPIIIEDDCWLGFSCEILSGVHIGKHSIVAARAVVTKDVPAYSIVAGNPARIVKTYNQTTQKWERLNQ